MEDGMENDLGIGGVSTENESPYVELWNCLKCGAQNSGGYTRCAFCNPLTGLDSVASPQSKIMTSYVSPPIPIRDFDWVAWIDGEEDGHRGHGKTEREAIDELHNALAQFDPERRA
jgi:hypothetical protein